MSSGSVLAVPAWEPGRGGGHLVRGAELVRSLRSLHREAFLFLPSLQENESFLLKNCLQALDPQWITDDENLRPWDFIVLDRFQTPPEEFTRWSALAPLIGIDEGGQKRDDFDFLIDLLPGLPEVSSPNLLAPDLLPLPRNRRGSFFPSPQQRPLKILVSFGAEDPAGLTLPVCAALAPCKDLRITALMGGLNRQEKPEIPGVTVVEAIPELREHLAEYDLVLTHFGLTAFECLAARAPVMLVSPTAYHERLARHAGFLSAGVGPGRAARLPKLSSKNLQALGAACEKIAGRYNLIEESEERKKNLGNLLASWAPQVPRGCPVCASPRRETLARFPERTYRRCLTCGMVYMLRSAAPPIAYEREYFFDFYKRQYGKTYLEDFPHLIQTGKARLKHLKALLRSPQGAAPRLLDIGCAYGPFLAAAQEEGFSPTGIDPAGDAVKYVQEELKLPAFQGFFPGAPFPALLKDETFEAVSLWYVIEHFENPGEVLREIRRILKPGGALCFSTPSFSGISRRVSVRGFLSKSPADHWTIWEPRFTRGILKDCGFTLRKIVVSGHHPERFPLGGGLTQKRGFLYGFFLWISRLFRLGDTFEVYAVKNNNRWMK